MRQPLVVFIGADLATGEALGQDRPGLVEVGVHGSS